MIFLIRDIIKYYALHHVLKVMKFLCILPFSEYNIKRYYRNAILGSKLGLFIFYACKTKPFTTT